ncbi:MAG: N-succinylarginine dihydrolase [Candidatus Pelagadaptatus aseana]|uniref:N-succinylarginine dihydrolase n=1 Tax=Candidatus Pelagadaptatus aseana TaxID=3120508 RepID=UPI0039B2E822
MQAFEVNFDGLIGPNHNYSGLAFGNLASFRNAKNVSKPKQAALQGLEKMRTLLNLGYKQGFILPQERPDIGLLRRLGFTGSDRDVITSAANKSPELLPMIYSASSMWAANAATVTPSMDSSDGRCHFTPANLITTNHRAIEHHGTQKTLSLIFNDERFFKVHNALPSLMKFADEGAANHTRLTPDYNRPGVGLFVYGRDDLSPNTELKFPARQTLQSCVALARQHELDDTSTIFLQQSSEAINAGAFHNDVVAVGNGPVLFYHEAAFEESSRNNAFAKLNQVLAFQPICVTNDKVSLKDAISSYLFNSQLLANKDGDMTNMRLIAPTECRDNPAVNHFLQALVNDVSQPIRHVEFVDVRQSMSNGGGPACLRLRVTLTEQELDAVHPAFILNHAAIDRLHSWVSKHYRDELSPDDLKDPDFMEECRTALDDLTGILGIGNFYDFQR